MKFAYPVLASLVAVYCYAATSELDKFGTLARIVTAVIPAATCAGVAALCRIPFARWRYVSRVSASAALFMVLLLASFYVVPLLAAIGVFWISGSWKSSEIVQSVIDYAFAGSLPAMCLGLGMCALPAAKQPNEVLLNKTSGH